jgi:hypothetical protein
MFSSCLACAAKCRVVSDADPGLGDQDHDDLAFGIRERFVWHDAILRDGWVARSDNTNRLPNRYGPGYGKSVSNRKTHMALQLGALRDAFLAANVPPEKASAAAEEVAAYDTRLTHLTPLVQVALGLLVVLLGSQAAIWIKMGEISGQLAQLAHAASP